MATSYLQVCFYTIVNQYYIKTLHTCVVPMGIVLHVKSTNGWKYVIIGVALALLVSITVCYNAVDQGYHSLY